MHQSLRPVSLVPSGFVVVSAIHDATNTTITVRGSKESAACPSCGTVSRRVHSRYHRRVGDLPLSGRSVELVVVARRFRCDAVLCGRQIFVERFASDVLAPSARRTGRLDCIVHHLGLALGGRPAASFARRLMLPVSNDTLLRVVRRRAHLPTEPLNIIGIDDWAWRRNHRYGTIICDLERRRPVTLLPDRDPATATAWLERHQEITVVARDRGGGSEEKISAAAFAGRRLLVIGVQADELRATRKPTRQAALLAKFEEIKPTSMLASSFAWGIEGAGWNQACWNDRSGNYEKMLDRLRQLDGKSGKKSRDPLNQDRDILIAETAITNHAILVSGDENLRQVVSDFGGGAIATNQFETEATASDRSA
jgi:zinc-finger of transposase IS204/IS1001/IS1096/IS1165/Transposase